MTRTSRLQPADILSIASDAAALRRDAQEDANNIRIETHDGQVLLRGWVHADAERKRAEYAAWAMCTIPRLRR